VKISLKTLIYICFVVAGAQTQPRLRGTFQLLFVPAIRQRLLGPDVQEPEEVAVSGERG
jgi:hypothetical protein